MKMLITGDVSDWNLQGFDPGRLTQKGKQLIQSVDCAIYNLEGPIKHPGVPHEFKLRSNPLTDSLLKLLLRATGNVQPRVISSPSMLQLMALSPQACVTLATNHVKDIGKSGLLDTLDCLLHHNIKTVGAEMTASLARRALPLNDSTVVLNANRIASTKMGIPFHIYDATKRDFGAAYFTPAALKREIAILHETHKHVLLILHAGMEMPPSADRLGINFDALADLGADLTVIHHPHVYVATENEKRNIFVLGDFIFWRPDCLPPDRPTAALTLDTSGGQLSVHLERMRVSDIYNYTTTRTPKT
ncbi:MAG: hypothetical protein ACI9X0_001273 [Kiritimatiellia bacterium]|jgi:hypothetical protein